MLQPVPVQTHLVVPCSQVTSQIAGSWQEMTHVAPAAHVIEPSFTSFVPQSHELQPLGQASRHVVVVHSLQVHAADASAVAPLVPDVPDDPSANRPSKSRVHAADARTSSVVIERTALDRATNTAIPPSAV